MSKLSREARQRIYREERARLVEEQRKADEQAVAAMSSEDRKKILKEETAVRTSKKFWIVLAVIAVAVAYYYGMEHLHEETRREARLYQPKPDDTPALRELRTEIMGRPPRTQRDVDALERWMPWRW